MSEQPLVTVLMAVYNGGEYLRASVKSVLDQSFRDIEFLIVNDCSTDNTVEIIESFHDDRVVIHTNDENMGQTKSLNAGLRLAKGRYIARMDADDEAFNEWLEKLVEFIGKYPEYAAVSCTALAMNQDGITKKLLRTPVNFEEVIFHIFFGNAMNHVGSLINKEILLSNGGYNEEFKIVQDYELWSSLIRKKYRIISIPDVLVAVRVHESSLGFMEEKKRGLQEVSEVICRNVNELSDVKISHDEAVQLRMFYRFPEQLSLKEFEDAHEKYKDIFSHLKDEFEIPPAVLNEKLRALMAIPYYKGAMGHVVSENLKDARGVLMRYMKAYGFNIAFLAMFLATFSGKYLTMQLSSIFHIIQAKSAKTAMSRVKL